MKDITTKRKTILTGDRPTGPLHLGHYAGSLLNRLALQNKYKTYILIADVQALTDNFHHPEILKKNIMEVMLDYLAIGLDPEKVTFVLQSLVPEIHELTIYYLNVVTLARAFRNPTVKSEIQEKRHNRGNKKIFGNNMDIPIGFLVYPVHQAADITVFDAHLVPVGLDQLPMIEQTREIVRKMNTYYGEGLLIEPEAKIGEFPKIPGIDGNSKMSKSIGNCIYLKDSVEKVKKAVKKMFTDPKRIKPDIPGTVENNPVFIYHDAFNPDKEEVNDLKYRYTKGKVGDVEVKTKLAKAINTMLEPVRENRKLWEQRQKDVESMLYDHTAMARKTTRNVLNRVREGMKLKPLTSS
jgi:tryptophanyl-tRNA synthetase